MSTSTYGVRETQNELFVLPLQAPLLAIAIGRGTRKEEDVLVLFVSIGVSLVYSVAVPGLQFWRLVQRIRSE